MQYPSNYSLINTTQEFSNITLLSSTVAFDKGKGFGQWVGNTTIPQWSSVTVGMPWIYRDNVTGNIMYTMNNLESLIAPPVVTPTPDPALAANLTSNATVDNSSVPISNNSLNSTDSNNTATKIASDSESVGSIALGDVEIVAIATNDTSSKVLFPGNGFLRNTKS